MDRVSQSDIMTLQICALRRKAALAYARQGKRALSAQSFSEIRTLLTRSRLAIPARLTILSFLASAQAYFDFKFQDRPEAERQLTLSLRLDRILNDRYRLDKIDIHRLQTLSNFARMKKADHDVTGALGLLWNGVCYCEGDDAAWPITGSDLRHPVVRRSEIWTVMTRQLLGEFVLALSEHQHGPLRDDMRDLLATRVLPSKAGLPVSWLAALHAKHALLSADYDSFFEHAAKSLDAGFQANPLVCLLLMQDARDCLRSTNPSTAEVLSDMIRTAKTGFQRIPKILADNEGTQQPAGSCERNTVPA